MSRALREMIVEVAEELGRVDPKDWDKLLCGDDDGVKGVLKVLAVREPATFGMLICRCIPLRNEPLSAAGQCGNNEPCVPRGPLEEAPFPEPRSSWTGSSTQAVSPAREQLAEHLIKPCKFAMTRGADERL
jgi:hypothetical protein